MSDFDPPCNNLWKASDQQRFNFFPWSQTNCRSWSVFAHISINCCTYFPFSYQNIKWWLKTIAKYCAAVIQTVIYSIHHLMNHHLMVVERFVCPSDCRGYVSWGVSPLVESPKANWPLVEDQTNGDCNSPCDRKIEGTVYLGYQRLHPGARPEEGVRGVGLSKSSSKRWFMYINSSSIIKHL